MSTLVAAQYLQFAHNHVEKYRQRQGFRCFDLSHANTRRDVLSSDNGIATNKSCLGQLNSILKFVITTNLLFNDLIKMQASRSKPR